jgi:hypothetical protein
MSIMDPAMWHDSDDALIQEVKEALARERAVPDQVIQAAMDAYDLRHLDAELELLSLSFDSLMADAAGVRGLAQDGPRMLVFDGEELTLELEIGDDVLMGQVVPARSDRVIVECADGRVDEADADDAGFFLLRRPAHGPIRLKLRQASNVVTGWISI